MVSHPKDHTTSYYMMCLFNCAQHLQISWAFTRAFPEISGYVGMGAQNQYL